MAKRKPKKTAKPIRVDVAPRDVLRMYCEQFPDALTRYQQGKRSNDTALDSLRGWLDIQQRVGGADDHVAEFRRRFELTQAGYVRAVEWLTTIITTIGELGAELNLSTDTKPVYVLLYALPGETSEHVTAAEGTVRGLLADLSVIASKGKSADGEEGMTGSDTVESKQQGAVNIPDKVQAKPKDTRTKEQRLDDIKSYIAGQKAIEKVVGIEDIAAGANCSTGFVSQSAPWQEYKESKKVRQSKSVWTTNLLDPNRVNADGDTARRQKLGHEANVNDTDMLMDIETIREKYPTLSPQEVARKVSELGDEYECTAGHVEAFDNSQRMKFLTAETAQPVACS